MRWPLILALLLLGGCSALSEQQCRLGDWYGLGYQDGQAGRTRTHLDEYHKSCAEYAITPDLERWQAGYDKGLAFYCIPELAYAKGKNGDEYHGVCPNDASFRQRYERGRAEYQVQQQLDEIADELDRLQDERERVWKSYRHSQDDAERHELGHRLRQFEWHALDLQQQYMQIKQQQLQLLATPRE